MLGHHILRSEIVSLLGKGARASTRPDDEIVCKPLQALLLCVYDTSITTVGLWALRIQETQQGPDHNQSLISIHAIAKVGDPLENTSALAEVAAV